MAAPITTVEFSMVAAHQLDLSYALLLDLPLDMRTAVR
ncbi:hypothetical protein N7490_008690 [Penicillium lividum]|nr:hypothetical protein N7490_008690 [Penicillium lividum]